jgi:hypothetical protein
MADRRFDSPAIFSAGGDLPPRRPAAAYDRDWRRICLGLVTLGDVRGIAWAKSPGRHTAFRTAETTDPGDRNGACPAPDAAPAPPMLAVNAADYVTAAVSIKNALEIDAACWNESRAIAGPSLHAGSVFSACAETELAAGIRARHRSGMRHRLAARACRRAWRRYDRIDQSPRMIDLARAHRGLYAESTCEIVEGPSPAGRTPAADLILAA